MFGGMSVERQLLTNCTSPDNPNTLRFCDDTVNSLPWRKTFKAAGSYPLPHAASSSAPSFQSNQPSPPITNATTANMTFTRGTTRYPARLPGAVPGRPDHRSVGDHEPDDADGSAAAAAGVLQRRASRSSTSKVSKTFKFNRVSVLPTFEMFSVNNSDAIISYQSLSILSAQAPGAELRSCGRDMIGIGAISEVARTDLGARFQVPGSTFWSRSSASAGR